MYWIQTRQINMQTLAHLSRWSHQIICLNNFYKLAKRSKRRMSRELSNLLAGWLLLTQYKFLRGKYIFVLSSQIFAIFRSIVCWEKKKFQGNSKQLFKACRINNCSDWDSTWRFCVSDEERRGKKKLYKRRECIKYSELVARLHRKKKRREVWKIQNI